jgi:hypothetical protein
MTNQPTTPVNKNVREDWSKPTFQDKLLEITKVFWKAGYSYSKTGRNEDFYARLVEDFMMLPEEDFLNKYKE